MMTKDQVAAVEAENAKIDGRICYVVAKHRCDVADSKGGQWALTTQDVTDMVNGVMEAGNALAMPKVRARLLSIVGRNSGGGFRKVGGKGVDDPATWGYPSYAEAKKVVIDYEKGDGVMEDDHHYVIGQTGMWLAGSFPALWTDDLGKAGRFAYIANAEFTARVHGGDVMTVKAAKKVAADLAAARAEALQTVAATVAAEPVDEVASPDMIRAERRYEKWAKGHLPSAAPWAELSGETKTAWVVTLSVDDDGKKLADDIRMVVLAQKKLVERAEGMGLDLVFYMATRDQSGASINGVRVQ